MLDMKFVRENLPAVQEMLKNRCNALDLSSFTELEERRRAVLQDVEEKKARRNAVSKEIGVRKKAGESADDVVAEMRALGDEITALAAIARDYPIKMRFIELMPIGCARTEGYRGVPMDEVRAHLKEAFGALLPVGEATHGNAVPVGPAAYVRPAGFLGTLGFIDAMEHKFCDTCNRVRLTAEGFLKLCLYSNAGLDTRALLRGGVTDAQLREHIAHAVWKKPAEHYFEMDSETRDQRAMYQVGG